MESDASLPSAGHFSYRMEEEVSLDGDREEGSTGIISDAAPPSGQLCLQPLDSPKFQVSLKPEIRQGFHYLKRKTQNN